MIRILNFTFPFILVTFIIYIINKNKCLWKGHIFIDTINGFTYCKRCRCVWKTRITGE